MNLEGSEYLCPIDPLEYESWPLLQNIEELAVTHYNISENPINNCEPPALAMAENGGAAAAVTQYSIFENAINNNEPPALATAENGGAAAPAAAPQVVQPRPRRLNRQSKSSNSKTRKKKYSPENEDLKNQKILVEEQSADEEGTSVAKKMNHNAKERIRRMKLNASYLSLRALLPDNSRSRSKRRWSAPVIVDRVLKYIPDLENEIETLKLKKQNYITQSGESSEISPDQNSQQTGSGTTVSVNEVKEGEAIIQICMENSNSFTKLLQKVEDEQGICIQSASTLHVSQNRFCYHLHIKKSESSILANYVEGLRDKVISWLK